MMKIIPPLLVLLLYGCAHFSGSNSLYTEFAKYKTSVDESRLIDSYPLYFDPLLTGNIDIDNPSTASQLEFSKYMTREITHYEEVRNSKGCLTVNGVGSEDNPIAFYIEYKNIDNKWLISDIDVSFLDEIKEYKRKALCPSQTRVE